MEDITNLTDPPDGTREAVPAHLRAWASALRRRDYAKVVPITAAPSPRVIRLDDAYACVGGRPTRPKPSRWPRTPHRLLAATAAVGRLSTVVDKPTAERQVRQLLIPLQRDETP